MALHRHFFNGYRMYKSARSNQTYPAIETNISWHWQFGVLQNRFRMMKNFSQPRLNCFWHKEEQAQVARPPGSTAQGIFVGLNPVSMYPLEKGHKAPFLMDVAERESVV